LVGFGQAFRTHKAPRNMPARPPGQEVIRSDQGGPQLVTLIL
jgi:hypothetical protein